MIDSLSFLLVAELLGLAFLPLTFRMLHWLPDRGYPFAKILGILLVTYAVWLIGNGVAVANSWLLPAVLLVVGAGANWILWRKSTIAALRRIARVVVIEEVIFLAAFTIWTLLRVYVFHPGIAHTEQYMDLTLLQSALRSHSFPPYDPWMSGRAVNYYYFGYLMMANVIKLSGIAVTVGYNLILSLLFALTVSAAFSIGLALTRRVLWACLAPIFLAILGNWHALVQGWASLTTSGGFWESTRVVGSANDYTINEFPFFSFMLGDVHPHVLALPLTLLAVAVALAITRSPFKVRLSRRSAPMFLLVAVTLGSLFATNSWDFPTYGLLIACGLVINGYLKDQSPGWWKDPALASASLAVASVIVFLPFYVHFKSLAHGIGRVDTPAALSQFLQIFGPFLLPVAALLLTLGLVLQPAADEPSVVATDPALEAGRFDLKALDSPYFVYASLGVALLIVGLRFQLWTLILVALVGAAAVSLLTRVVNTEHPNRADAFALLLVALACLVLSFTEIFYLKDSFDGTASYRMNTVFKFYYQAWTVLALAAAYSVYRARNLLARFFSLNMSRGVAAVLACSALAAGVYTIGAPRGFTWSGTAASLDGMSQLQASPSDDYRVIRWMQSHISGNPVELEATGGEYDFRYARVSTFTGLPTLMGWAGHELQWRGSDPAIQQRVNVVNKIYRTTSASTAKRLMNAYKVRYVFVGSTEETSPGFNLAKFGRFMRVADRAGSTILYVW